MSELDYMPVAIDNCRVILDIFAPEGPGSSIYLVPFGGNAEELI